MLFRVRWFQTYFHVTRNRVSSRLLSSSSFTFHDSVHMEPAMLLIFNISTTMNATSKEKIENREFTLPKPGMSFKELRALYLLLSSILGKFINLSLFSAPKKKKPPS